MTWWSEHSAVPRLVLAKLAIRCRFVDRFVGSRAPSRVSGQRFSPRGASLPSVGSRRTRFPVFIGTTKALRLPARANLVPYGFGCRPHAPLLCSCIAEALPTGPEEARQAWNTWSAGVPCPACRTRGRVRDLTGFLATHPMPLPCSKTPAEPTKPRLSWSCRHRPRPTQTEGLSLHIISRLTSGLQHPLSTLHEWRCRRPCKTRFRLAGCASTGRGSNPLDRFERFQVTSHSPFQDFSCRKSSL
jgi:hypothetical protein